MEIGTGKGVAGFDDFECGENVDHQSLDYVQADDDLETDELLQWSPALHGVLDAGVEPNNCKDGKGSGKGLGDRGIFVRKLAVAER